MDDITSLIRRLVELSPRGDIIRTTPSAELTSTVNAIVSYGEPAVAPLVQLLASRPSSLRNEPERWRSLRAIVRQTLLDIGWPSFNLLVRAVDRQQQMEAREDVQWVLDQLEDQLRLQSARDFLLHNSSPSFLLGPGGLRRLDGSWSGPEDRYDRIRIARKPVSPAQKLQLLGLPKGLSLAIGVYYGTRRMRRHWDRDGDEYSVWDEEARDLARLGNPVLDLIMAMSLKSDGLTGMLVDTILWIDDPAAVAKLMEIALHPNPDFRFSAVAALIRIGDPRAVPAFRGAVHDPDSKVRLEAMRGLSAFASLGVLPELVAGIRDQVGEVAQAAVAGIAKIDEVAAVEALKIALVGGMNYGAGQCAAGRLSELIRGTDARGDAESNGKVSEPLRALALQVLLDAFHSPDCATRQVAVALAESGHPEALSALLSELENCAPELVDRRRAIEEALVCERGWAFALPRLEEEFDREVCRRDALVIMSQEVV